MIVLLGGMFVPVIMAGCGPGFVMRVIMMVATVAVKMLMGHKIVPVEMGVLLAEEDQK